MQQRLNLEISDHGVLGRVGDLHDVTRLICCRQPEILVTFTDQRLKLTGQPILAFEQLLYI
jgi:hypothetical protein